MNLCEELIILQSADVCLLSDHTLLFFSSRNLLRLKPTELIQSVGSDASGREAWTDIRRDQISADMCDDIFTSYQTSDTLTADSLTM